MDYTHLGRTGSLVSRICLGTMNFGAKTVEDDAHVIMDRAVEYGINFFDTADAYGGRVGEGVTERIIGRWFAKGGGRREKIVLATKVYSRMGDGPNQGALSARHIRMACDASLRRLNVDWIDLYQMHHVDRRTPWDEIWEAMETLRAQGKIIYTGSSNFGGWHIASAQGAAHEHKLTGLVSEQSLYNLFKREVELEVIPAIQQYGLALLPWSPLLAGALAGAASAPAVHGDRRMARRNKAMADHSETLLAYQALCQQLGKPPAQVGLAWLLHQAAVTAPIVGPRSVDHLDTAVGAVDLRLSDDDLIRLDEIFPGHRPAPEDYAW